MERITLQTHAIAVQVVPKFGARITSLVDRRTGRDWLVGGALVGDVSDDAAFLGDEARGWDECFPTVAPCPSNRWGRTLRDHGDLWARGWQVEAANDKSVVCRYDGDEFSFCRTLAVDDETVSCHYSVTGSPRPYLYSQHMLLATEPGERIVLHGIGPLASGGAPMPWPAGNDIIADVDSGIACKAYGPAKGQARAEVTGPKGGISIDWDAQELPYFGMWRCFGGWPESVPVHQLALEPTTAPADHLADALGQGAATMLNPETPATWTINVTLTRTAVQEVTP